MIDKRDVGRGVVVGLLVAGCGGREVVLDVVGLDAEALRGQELCLQWQTHVVDPFFGTLPRRSGLTLFSDPERLELEALGRVEVDGSDVEELFVAGLWIDKPHCRPCSADGEPRSGDYPFCPADYLGVSEAFSVQDRKASAELVFTPTSELRASAWWDAGDVRYVRRPWPRPEEAAAELSVAPRVSSVGDEVPASVVAVAPAADSGSCETSTEQPVAQQRLFDATFDVDPLRIPLSTAADTVCVSVGRFHVWGPWEAVPTEVVVGLEGKVVGREFPNPHQFAVLPGLPAAFPPSLDELDPRASGPGEALSAAEDGLAITSRADRRWVGGLPLQKQVSAIRPRQVVYDPRAREVLAVGSGVGAPTIWSIRGGEWRVAAVDCEQKACPFSRAEFAATGDQDSGSVALFGGRLATQDLLLNDLWQFRDGEWTQRGDCAAGAVCPNPRAGHAMVGRPGAQPGLLVFGGQSASGAVQDTWIWDGDGWQPGPDCEAPGDCPSPRWGHAMALDTARDEVVLFGGRDATGALFDTWVFASGRWSGPLEDCTPGVDCPSPRWGHAMAFDRQRSVAVLFGGESDESPGSQGAGPLDQRWIWDGGGWRTALDACADELCPPTGSGYSMAYDRAHDELVALRGADEPSAWRLGGDDGAQPVHVVRVPLWAIDLPIESLHRGSVVLAAGAGSSGAEAGVSVLAWDGGWVDIASGPGTASAPATVAGRTDDGGSWVTDVDPRGPSATFAIQPAVAQGEGTPLSTDFFEARFLYLPAE